MKPDRWCCFCDICNRHGPYENTTDGQFAYITQGNHREQHEAMASLAKLVSDFADEMRVDVGGAAARLAEVMAKTFAPRNFISIHPGTIRRMHATALNTIQGGRHDRCTQL